MFAIQKSLIRAIATSFNPLHTPIVMKGLRVMKGKVRYIPPSKLSNLTADFLIDNNGILQLAYYANNIARHSSLEMIFSLK